MKQLPYIKQYVLG